MTTTTTRLPATDPRPTAPAGRAWPSSPWPWMALACALLAASGGARWWQDRAIGGALQREEASAFPLKELPRGLGQWQMEGSEEGSLDPEIAQVAGCQDNMVRTYVDKATGVKVVAVVLFGRAAAVCGHTPEVCYPATGHVPVGETSTSRIESGRGPALFRAGVYAKQSGPAVVFKEAYYAFRHDGQWFPDALGAWKQFRRHPWMYKVQVQRIIRPDEQREDNNPTEQFLAALLPEIERRIAAPAPPARKEG